MNTRGRATVGKAGWVPPLALLGLLSTLAWANPAAAAARPVNLTASPPGVNERLQEQDLVEPQDPAGTSIAVDPAWLRRVRLLQRQLNSDDASQRDIAEQALVDLGSGVLDFLPNESPSFSAEFNTRLNRIRLSLEAKAASEVIQPLSVQLQGQVTVQEALAAIEQQTRNRTGAPPLPPETKLNVQWEGVSYWQAIDDLADRLKLAVQTEQAAGVWLMPSEEATPRAALKSYHGGFRTSPTRIQYTRDLTKTRPGVGMLGLALEWEPKLRVIRLELPLESVLVQHPVEVERSLALGGENQKISFGVIGEQKSSNLSLPLPSLGDWGAPTIDLNGKFNLLVAGREETFKFENLKTALETKQMIEKSGIKVRLEDIDYDDHLMLVRIGIEFSDAKESLESHFGWIYQNTVQLVDREQQTYSYLTIESGGQRDQGISLIYLFDKFEDLDGIQLIYGSPGILLEVEVPFELKGIPLQ